jgi:hypothetical protein
MELLKNFALYEFGFLLAAFAAVLVYKFLSGGVSMRGLLREKTPTGVGAVSAARVQLLLATFAMAFYILAKIIEESKFPDIPTKYILMLGGSHSVFLGAKGVLSLFSTEPK